MNQNIANKALVIVPPPPRRYSLNDWHRNIKDRYLFSENQQQLADKVLEESKRVRDLTEESCELNKNETNHCLEQRIKDIEFRKTETEKQRALICIEIDSFCLYKNRISDAMNSIKSDCLPLCQKCIILREARLGIDLVHDNVERELLREQEVISGVLVLLKSILEQVQEQVRRLRSTIYFMDRDLEHKDNSVKIDKHNASLKETSLNLSMYHGFSSLASSNVTIEEWDAVTKKNYKTSAEEINSSLTLKSYVDALIKQAIGDLINQYNRVNEAFRCRIEETKEAKNKLEIEHFETVRQLNEMLRNITELEKAIANKEGYMALAHTRLGNRAQRPELELCKDVVEVQLVNEVYKLGHNVNHLQQMLSEAEASMRYLMKTQIQLEEDINIKTNTLKIDEVDCMTLRQSMDYHSY